MCAFLYERGIQGKQCDPFTIATAFIQEQCVSVSLTVPLQREQGQLLTQAKQQGGGVIILILAGPERPPPHFPGSW